MRKESTLSRLYHTNPILISAVIGGFIGYFLLSPLAMIVEHATHTEIESLSTHMTDMFLLRNPLWTTLFTLLGVSIGLIFGYLQRRIHTLEAGLFQAEKLASVGQLASGIAHEMNTPLSNISIITDSLKMKTSGEDPSVKENLEEISAQVDNASKIVKDMLDFSMTSDLEMMEVDVNELLSDTVSFIKSKRKEKVIVKEEYGDDLPMIMGEPKQLMHVFLNLMNNAYDAMPNGGGLAISTDIGDSRFLTVTFTDTGKGIPKENLSKIFDPFFTTKKPGKGTGLGLSICHGIIRNHGGRIEVNSRINGGTSFTIALPR